MWLCLTSEIFCCWHTQKRRESLFFEFPLKVWSIFICHNTFFQVLFLSSSSTWSQSYCCRGPVKPIEGLKGILGPTSTADGCDVTKWNYKKYDFSLCRCQVHTCTTNEHSVFSFTVIPSDPPLKHKKKRKNKELTRQTCREISGFNAPLHHFLSHILNTFHDFIAERYICSLQWF